MKTLKYIFYLMFALFLVLSATSCKTTQKYTISEDDFFNHLNSTYVDDDIIFGDIYAYEGENHVFFDYTVTLGTNDDTLTYHRVFMDSDSGDSAYFDYFNKNDKYLDQYNEFLEVKESDPVHNYTESEIIQKLSDITSKKSE